MSLKKDWKKPPNVLPMDSASLLARHWARPQLLRVRDLVAQALALIEESGDPESIAKTRETLAAIDAKLMKTDAPRGGTNAAD
jgi:hypothetical protein